MRLIDARGDGLLLAVYASPTGAWAACVPLFVDAKGMVSGERAHAVSPGSLDELGPLEIEFVSFTWSGTAPITESYLVGTAGEGVTRIEIRTPGRPSVLASLANGWWAAWTPGPMPAIWSIVALDALGREVETIEGVPQVGA